MHSLITILTFLLSFNLLLITTSFAEEAIITPNQKQPETEQLCPKSNLQPEWEAHWICEDDFCYLLLVDINNGDFYQLPIPQSVIDVLKQQGKYKGMNI
jgi:hypothetical protein